MTISCARLREEMVDREAIRDCLMRYCRAIDRMDRELLLSVYWPDAIDNHLEFIGSPPEFVEYCFPLMAKMEQTMHTLGNMLIVISGGEAQVESYFHAFHRIKGIGDAPPRDLVAAGRYLDSFVKRDDHWRIHRRTVVMDWFRDYQDSADWSNGLLGIETSPGSREPEDISYRLLEFLR